VPGQRRSCRTARVQSCSFVAATHPVVGQRATAQYSAQCCGFVTATPCLCYRAYASCGRNQMVVMEGRTAARPRGPRSGSVRWHCMHGHDRAWPSRSTTKPVSWREALRSRPLALRARPRQSVALQIHNQTSVMEGSAAVASPSAPCTATTERGPPDRRTLDGHDGEWPSRSPEKMRAKPAQVPAPGTEQPRTAYEPITSSNRWRIWAN
jgi:hypothetical protein